ncbi:putative triacylglycerol lipase [Helianthus anomalus]
MANVASQKLLLFVIYVVANGIMIITVHAETGKTNAPIFIFGDSTADVGTNNFLKTCTAKADHLYNGIDFPYSKSTGRFSNGKNAADLVGIYLNFSIRPNNFLVCLCLC